MQQENSIGLAELIQHIKQELLTPSPDAKDVPLLSVDSVELELQVTVRREGKGGVKVNVVSIGGAEMGGGMSHDAVQTVKIHLSPLLDKAQLLEYYKTLHPDQMTSIVKCSLDALFKGNDHGANEEVI
jgi:hypothetical protein